MKTYAGKMLQGLRDMGYKIWNDPIWRDQTGAVGIYSKSDGKYIDAAVKAEIKGDYAIVTKSSGKQELVDLRHVKLESIGGGITFAKDSK